MHYIISLNHTQRTDIALVLWQSDNAGYTYAKEAAGIYENPEPGYHDGDCAMPVSVEVADTLFMTDRTHGGLRKVIPNCKVVWEALGLKMTRNGLKRKNVSPY